MCAMIGWVLVVVSGAVMILTFPVPKSGGPPLVPGLIPVFGVAFAIVWAALQYVLALWIRSRKGVVLISVLLLAGAGTGWYGRAMDVWGQFAKAGVSCERHILASAACISGLGFGIGMIKTYVHDERKARRR